MVTVVLFSKNSPPAQPDWLLLKVLLFTCKTPLALYTPPPDVVLVLVFRVMWLLLRVSVPSSVAIPAPPPLLPLVTVRSLIVTVDDDIRSTRTPEVSCPSTVKSAPLITSSTAAVLLLIVVVEAVRSISAVNCMVNVQGPLPTPLKAAMALFSSVSVLTLVVPPQAANVGGVCAMMKLATTATAISTRCRVKNLVVFSTDPAPKTSLFVAYLIG